MLQNIIFKKLSEDYLKWYAEHIFWFNDLKEKSYGYNGFPWTRLGYTFDWGGDANDDYWLSEFIIKKGASIEIESITKTQDYCNQ